jgi:hypothetical protein
VKISELSPPLTTADTAYVVAVRETLFIEAPLPKFNWIVEPLAAPLTISFSAEPSFISEVVKVTLILSSVVPFDGVELVERILVPLDVNFVFDEEHCDVELPVPDVVVLRSAEGAVVTFVAVVKSIPLSKSIKKYAVPEPSAPTEIRNVLISS